MMICLVSLLLSQEKSKAGLEKGCNFTESRVYSDADKLQILKLFEGLRVVDVSEEARKQLYDKAGMLSDKTVK